MRSPIPLGPFELLEPVGSGSMGDVWRGVHRRERAPVAIKVLTRPLARQEEYQWVFRSEVRAVAALDHPGIVAVFDLGRIDPGVEAATGGRLPDGSPYLVMELVEGIPLSGICGRLPFAALRPVLLCLLDALAHAHARGVVHRDVKPANILLDRSGRRVKLTDFGVAHTLFSDGPLGGCGAMSFDGSASNTAQPCPAEHEIAGTPNYMAPEQCIGSWRDFGPWTDLYALGCTAWTAATGAPPFQRPGIDDVRRAHLGDPLPPFRPVLPVPRGFEGWLRVLLEKNPADRFRRAADAAWALQSLDSSELVAGTGLPERDVLSDLDTLEAGTSTLDAILESRRGQAPTEPPDDPTQGTKERAVSVPGAVPPFPASWRRAERIVPRLSGVGLSLFGVRAIPLVGREPEQDALWAALARVRISGSCRAVLILGPAGCGKTRLAEWLCERAHEVGAATALHAAHAPAPGKRDGLAPMLARYLRVAGSSPGGGIARAERFVRDAAAHGGPPAEEDEWLSLAAMAAPIPDGGTDGAPGAPTYPPLRLESAAERRMVVWRFLARLCAERPVVVRIDDVQHGRESIELVRWFLAEQRLAPLPVLFVLTARDELLADGCAGLDSIRTLEGRRDVETLRPGTLDEEHHAELVREVLGLDGALARQVEERTGGNPMFALHLVRDWVSRGVLLPGPRGFGLRPGADAELPDDLHDVWGAAVERLLAGRPTQDALALEVAAVLGRDMSPAEWTDACGLVGAEPPWELVDLLLARRLARSSGDEQQPDGRCRDFWFSHEMLRESIVRRARDFGRWEMHNEACAAVLSHRAGPNVAERLGRHLLAAGQHARALGPLLAAAAEQLELGGTGRAQHLLYLREDALRALGVEGRDHRWGEGRALLCQVTVRSGDARKGHDMAAKLAGDARQYGWHALLPVALREQARALRQHTGDTDTARILASEAVELAVREGDRRLLGQCRRELANLLRQRGEYGESEICSKLAEEDLRAAGEPVAAASCLLNRAFARKNLGDLRSAAALVAEARARFERAGSRLGVAYCLSELGEHARLKGDLPEAVQRYTRALRLARATGADVVFLELNLASVLTARGSYQEAAARLERLLPALEESGRLPELMATHASLLPCRAAAREWRAYDAAIETIRKIHRAAVVRYPDMPASVLEAARLAGDGGEALRAEEARILARELLDEPAPAQPLRAHAV